MIAKNGYIYIMNRFEAEKFTNVNPKQFRNTIVISISEYGKGAADIYVHENILDVLRLNFDDTDNAECSVMHPMQISDAISIKKFIKKWEHMQEEVKTIIIHCSAGKSRSAGVAAAISKYLFDEDSLVFEDGMYTPNMLCYRLTLNALMGE